VETEAQLHYLDQRGCQYVQGYLTGKPMPAHVAMAALKENLYVALLPSELRAGIQ
jgi:EAL domain-containing protein (putative c-di-GMP-specific phosphodiesterase class I)